MIDSHVHCRDWNQKHKESIDHALSVAERVGLSGIIVAKRLSDAEKADSNLFYGCLPVLTSEPEQIKGMVKAVLPLELKLASPEKIYSSVDYMTRCGIGICGSCADKKGRRTCVEGPFLSE